MGSIGKNCLAVFSLALGIMLLMACGNNVAKETVQNSGSKDLVKSSLTSRTNENEKSSSAKSALASSKINVAATNNSASNTVKTYDKPADTSESGEIPETRKHINMVQVNGHLYMDMGYINSNVTCGTADGEIKTTVEKGETPVKDDESNFGTGYGYQILDKIHVNVEMGNKEKSRWHIFQDIAISSWQIPESVAHFEAEVTEADKDRVLLKITKLPEEFSWIFKNKKAEEIKPVSLSREMADEAFAILSTLVEDSNMPGRKLKVWFDGEIKGDEAELSNPIELNEVYDARLILKDTN